MNHLVYLAGPIADLSYEGSTDWRKWVTENIHPAIITLSPMRFKGYLKAEVHIQASYEQFPLSSQKGITTRDRMDVMRCDALLVNFLGASQASIGTCIELGWADAWRKPVVLVMDRENVHAHAMVKEIAGYIVPTLSDGLDVLENLLLPGTGK